MFEKIKNTVLIALATLGVLFIGLMLWPDDEETSESEVAVATATVAETNAAPVAEATVEKVEEEVMASAETAAANETVSADSPAVAGTSVSQNDGHEASGNTVSVNIPQSELSSSALSFKTVTLDNKAVSNDIFKDYDITLVHVWGTFCRPCIAEMGEYAALYKELPSNVNLIAIICDVYDGIDSNVSDANKILSDAGAEFVNLRTSDTLYNVTASLQYVPSSFFVDSEGHVVGSMMDGAGFDETKKRLEGYLSQQ